ncbi:MAG: sigma 54-interacting transcriptional regulator [Myxococcota bacterium]
MEQSPSERELQRWLRRVEPSAAFRSLAELVPEAAVVVTTPDRRVVYWSAEAERMLGFDREQVLGAVCPDGVVCEQERPRPYGAAVRVARSDGGHVFVRHYHRTLFDGAVPAGTLHLLTLDPSGHAAAPLPGGPEVTAFHGLLTRDPAMLRLLPMIRNVAETDATVLVRGESGTGKELVARAIHQESPRRDGPFVAVNCAAFTPTLLESELFGHVKGAFTGAVANHRGIFARADGGTLFLDEVAELPLDLQAKLLRVLQERTFVPVGGDTTESTDVRVIAATHRALREEARKGRFREDLLYRLRVVPVFLPPLRERRLDLDPLIHAFVDEFNRRGPRRVTEVAPEAMRALLAHDWPGNVRELRNAIEYAHAVGRGPVLTRDQLPPELSDPAQARRVEPARRPGGGDQVRDALDAAGGDIDRAAESLGVSRTTFWRMRKRAGLV